MYIITLHCPCMCSDVAYFMGEPLENRELAHWQSSVRQLAVYTMINSGMGVQCTP